jgi:hypothetical protein
MNEERLDEKAATQQGFGAVARRRIRVEMLFAA